LLFGEETVMGEQIVLRVNSYGVSWEITAGTIERANELHEQLVKLYGMPKKPKSAKELSQEGWARLEQEGKNG
jgi:hypothetical protein